MSLFTLIFGQGRPVRIGAGVTRSVLPAGTIEFDAVTELTHTGNATVTQFPVETGADISDHIRPQPLIISFRGIISNTPNVFLPSAGVIDAARAEGAYETIAAMKDSQALVDLVTPLREYTGMAIESFVVNRDASSGNIVDVSLTLREVIQVATEEVDPTAQSDLGTQATSAASGPSSDAAIGAL